MNVTTMNRSLNPNVTVLKPAVRRIALRSFLGVALACGLCQGVQAQTINASALFNGVQSGVGYDYTVTLNNSASSTTSIETFWFAWSSAGENFLPTSPTSVTPPAGWTSSISNLGANDGFGIQFTTTTAALAPGASLNFHFSSADTPAQVSGNSPFYPTTPVGTSFVYEFAPFVGASANFVAQPVPEPSTIGLLLLGGVVLRRLLVSRA